MYKYHFHVVMKTNCTNTQHNLISWSLKISSTEYLWGNFKMLICISNVNRFVVLQQNEYTGLIESCPGDDQKSCGAEFRTSGEGGATSDTFMVEYGITSLVDKKTLLQPGDRVNTSNLSFTFP